jgi:hypothetical protein
MTKSYDIFNGDADGLCALHQLRLAAPRAAELVTGVKRDVKLLQHVAAGPGDELTVLDVSMKSNAAALALYRSFGFEETSRELRPSGEVLVMHKSL